MERFLFTYAEFMCHETSTCIVLFKEKISGMMMKQHKKRGKIIYNHFYSRHKILPTVKFSANSVLFMCTLSKCKIDDKKHV